MAFLKINIDNEIMKEILDLAEEKNIDIDELIKLIFELGFKKYIKEISKSEKKYDLSIELKEKIKYNGKKFDKESFDIEKFKKAVLEEGYTVLEFLKKEDIKISRQRFYVILKNLGINKEALIKNRKPQWYAIKYNVPDLADKAWIKNELKDKTEYAVIASLNIPLRVFDKVKKFFGIKVTEFRKIIKNQKRSYLEMMDLVCANPECRKKFQRVKRVIKKDQKDFYCNRRCIGVVLGKRFKEKIVK